eukprot:2655252-Amphidinium_carterae.1
MSAAEGRPVEGAVSCRMRRAHVSDCWSGASCMYRSRAWDDHRPRSCMCCAGAPCRAMNCAPLTRSA